MCSHIFILVLFIDNLVYFVFVYVLDNCCYYGFDIMVMVNVWFKLITHGWFFETLVFCYILMMCFSILFNVYVPMLLL